MQGKHHHQALSDAYDKDYLLEQGKKNGIKWQEHNHEGVNWMRFSNSLVNHVDSGNDFHHDNAHPQGMKTMLNHYIHLKELHKQSMVPHVRAAMSKLHGEGQSHLPHHELVQAAYRHLDSNGGHVWAEKVSQLHNLNGQIKKLSDRLQSSGQVP